MNPIYVARIGTDDSGARAIVFSNFDGESPQDTANSISQDFGEPLLELLLIEEFIGGELYEVFTL